MIILFLSSHVTVLKNVFLEAKLNRPNKCKNEISDALHCSILFILFNYTKLCTDPQVNKDFFLFEVFGKDSLSYSKTTFT